jgi:putative SOS response-associated peptidase YedK
MCGRFAQVFQIEDLEHIERIINQSIGLDQSMIELFAANYSPTTKPSYNIAPTQYATVLHPTSASPRSPIGATQAHFGLIPSWSKDRSRSSSMINARCETIASKPAYRDVYRSRRCILPINGFYEWQKLTAKDKQPWYIYRADDEPMFLAGVYDTWLDPEHGHSEVDSFSLITTHANEFIADKHHRMPIVLEPESIALWFDRAAEPRELESLLIPANEGILSAHRVSKRVNSPTNNDADLINETGPAGQGTLFG